MKRKFLIGLLAVAFPSVVSAQVTVAAEVYVCQRGVEVPVTYVYGTDPAMAFLLAEGKLVALRQVPSASGSFFASFDEQDGYRWRTRGSEAFLAWLAADHTASEVVLLEGCVLQ